MRVNTVVLCCLAYRLVVNRRDSKFRPVESDECSDSDLRFSQDVYPSQGRLKRRYGTLPTLPRSNLLSLVEVNSRQFHGVNAAVTCDVSNAEI